MYVMEDHHELHRKILVPKLKPAEESKTELLGNNMVA
jgi:hypothetical protein